MADLENEIEKMSERLQSIELRLARLESALNRVENEQSPISEEQVLTSGPFLNTGTLNEEEKGLESRIGRFGLAWLGNIVLLFGIIFLAEYMMNMGYRFLFFIIGYLASASIFLLAYYIKKANVHLAFIFRINAQILLFYITVRLHFFSVSPIIPGKTISIIILLILVAVQVYLSVRKESQTFASLAVLFALPVAILADATNLTLPIVILTAASSVFFYYKFNWEPLLLLPSFWRIHHFSSGCSGIRL